MQRLVLLLIAFSITLAGAVPSKVVDHRHLISKELLARFLSRSPSSRLLAEKRDGDAKLVERRAVEEDEFQNCFLSPVQCLLPRLNRRR